MSKPVKELIRNELKSRLAGVTSLAVVDFTGVDATTTNSIRARLRKKGIQVTVVKNALAKQAFKEIGLDTAAALITGPSAVAWGADSVVTVVRELLDIAKDAPTLTVKAALLEGEGFGADRIRELSRYPTRDEGIARALQAVLSAGGKLVASLLGPGGRLAGAIQAMEDKAPKAEEAPSGEAPAAAAPAEAPAAGPAPAAE